MPKRKSMDECIDDCKRFRDEQFPIDNSRSDHEKNHLVDINNNLSNFVRNSILIMVKQKEEIGRLNILIHNMRNALVISESSNVKNYTNNDIF